MATDSASPEPVRFETHPDRYKHWRLELPEEFGGAVCRLVMDVKEDGGLRPGYPLKLNSYDLGVDIELADALTRIRFEHPQVKTIVFASGKDRIFCSGANIYMLGMSSHAFKVNFCKFTNETRLYLEDMSESSGINSLAALAGTASGGGYELAIACDEIILAEDGNAAVSYPEAPLLAVLPGTGGLTRLTDKRMIRRDLADAFSTVAEGVRAKRALEWGLVDEAPPKAKFAEAVTRRTQALVARSKRKRMPKIVLPPLEATRGETGAEYKYVSLAIEAGSRVATLTVRAPDGDTPKNPDDLAKQGANAWPIRAFRELDDALLELRFNRLSVGVVKVLTTGDAEKVRAVDAMLAANKDDGLVNEVTLLMKRVLKRMDMTAKSFFALAEPGSCFVGSLLELALASDRLYMKDTDEGDARASGAPGQPFVGTTAMNGGTLPMGNGLTRLQSRFLKDQSRAKTLVERPAPLDTKAALKAGLVTYAPDDIDWDDEIRIAFEERASMSPDALTGMEQNLRFGGPETMETKIFARLTAWQNWIFIRPNATGEKGALTLYGKPERPEFNWQRT